MAKYMEYIKGGDILIAPALSYKHQYILKCSLCEEFFDEFPLFHSHYLSHYEMESNIEDDVDSITEDNNSFQYELMDEQELYDNIIVNEGETAAKAVENIAIECEKQSSERRDGYEEEDTKELYKDVDANGSVQQDAKPAEEFDIKEEVKRDQTAYEYPTINGNVNQNGVDNKSLNEFVKEFMTSKENVTALIAEYHNASHLWNFNVSTKYRKKEMRIKTWETIATNLREKINLKINSEEVATCLVYLRQKYRERKRNSDIIAKNNNDVLPAWIFKQLHFLNAFVESKPVAMLDTHQDLSPKQTAHLMEIFQRCLHLWDTNTAEYYCTNKRSEAFVKMVNLIIEEMDLEVEENALRNYLQRVREYVVLAKRREFGNTTAEYRRVKCHNHLLFLFDHVGPFKCSHCKRTVFSKLALKSCESQHTGTVPFQCPQCEKEFKNIETFVYHMRRHMGDFHKECKECGKKFLRLSDLEEHRRCHTGAKPFCCEICGASFRQRTGFGMHMKRHGKKYISFCPYCSKGFYSKDSMQMHSKSHTDERDFVCATCGKAFKTRKTLKSHVAIHEDGNHECTFCGKTFKNKINLWQHKRKHRINSGTLANPKQCSLIDETVKQNSS